MGWDFGAKDRENKEGENKETYAYVDWDSRETRRLREEKKDGLLGASMCLPISNLPGWGGEKEKEWIVLAAAMLRVDNVGERSRESEATPEVRNSNIHTVVLTGQSRVVSGRGQGTTGL